MQDTLNLCPRLRFVRAYADVYINEFARAKTEQDREFAISRALELGKLIINVVQPMAKELQGTAFATEYSLIANRLQRLARTDNWQLDPSLFPADDGRQLKIDLLQDLIIRQKEILADAGPEGQRPFTTAGTR